MNPCKKCNKLTEGMVYSIVAGGEDYPLCEDCFNKNFNLTVGAFLVGAILLSIIIALIAT